MSPPPIISSRNKSLVSLRESLQEGFLEHNINNKPQATLLPVIDDNSVRKPPACISPNPSQDNLRQQLAMALEEQQREQEQEHFVHSTQNLSLEARGPASIALANEEGERRKEEIALRKRKALAAKLRARGLSRKMVLKPSDFARSVFCRNRKTSNPTTNVPTFPDPTEIDMEIHAKHSQTIYDFVRKGVDLEGFKKCVRELQHTYHGKENSSQQPFRCSNRFGESLMHLACRRGRTEMVRFLVEELPGASPSEMLSIKDDCLKTPLHDACWTASPNFELVELILQHAPEQVVMQDIRGNTPFDYVRKEDYPLWLRFLWQRKSLLGPRIGRTSSSTMALPTN